MISHSNLETASIMLQEVLGLMEDEISKELIETVAKLLGEDKQFPCPEAEGRAESVYRVGLRSA